MSCGDASEVFDLAEEALDQVAILVDCCVKATPLGGCGSTRNDGLCSGCCDSVHGTPTVIALVGQNMTCRQPFEQSLDLGDVVAFAAGQDEANRIAQGIGCRMNLGA